MSYLKQMIAAFAVMGVFIALFLFAGLLHHAEPDQDFTEEQEEEAAAFIPHTKLQEENISLYIAGPKTLEIMFQRQGKLSLPSEKTSQIHAKAAGTIVAFHKNLGDTVQEGDVVATLESSAYSEAKGNYLAALATAELASSLLQRYEKQREKNLVTDDVYIPAKKAVEEAVIQYELKVLDLRRLGLTDQDIAQLGSQAPGRWGLLSVKANFPGTIIDAKATLGQYVEQTDPLFTLADTQQLKLKIPLYSRDLSSVMRGQSIELPQGKGLIEAIVPTLEEGGCPAYALATIPNRDGQLYPGAYFEAKICIDKCNAAVAVPTRALTSIEGIPILFVKAEKGFEKREVTLGKSDLSFTEIESGLNSGEEIAESEIFLLKAELLKGQAAP